MIDIDLRKLGSRYLAGFRMSYLGVRRRLGRTVAHTADALRQGARFHEDMLPEDFKGYHCEWAAFLFIARPRKDSLWGTFFAPFMIATQNDGKRLLSPDINDLDAEVVCRWEERARLVTDPVMRARYGDLIWDLKRVIVNEKPSYGVRADC